MSVKQKLIFQFLGEK